MHIDYFALIFTKLNNTFKKILSEYSCVNKVK